MCGRYYRQSDKQRLADAFRIQGLPSDLVLPDWDYNVAPSTFQPVVRDGRESGERELALMRWGLVPFFTKQLADVKGISTINAKAETLERSPTWRAPFAKRRCLVPADGYYEWKTLDDKTKRPYAFRLSHPGPFALAGLWDAWKSPGGEWLQSFSIVTTQANRLAADVHARMPVIVRPEDYDRWLRRSGDPPVELLRPYDADAMTVSPCNPLVGNVRNNGLEMLRGPG